MTQRLLAAAWRRPVWLLWVPPAFWAGNVVLGRAFSTSFPPVSLAVGRWLVALLALAPFVWRDVLRERRLLLRHWKLIWACGALGIAGYNALAYVALRTVPAASVAFLNSTLPLMVPLAAAMLGVERITSRAIVGIVVSFGGVAWIVARGHWEDLVALRFDHGELIVILATANYAIYSVLLRRKPAAIGPLAFLAATMATGLAVLAPFWALELAGGARIPFDPKAIGAVLYIGVFASLIAFILWGHCVQVLGATVTGVSFHLVALFTAVLAALTLGEPVRSYHLVGIALILFGFFVATRAAPGVRSAPNARSL